ncbi:hypothetical protein MHY1_p00166 (plasmid) [Methylovirgula sp. HY1]|nr:hypothetical protein MHY1_p00166 [Methylovirgula sp. HY1]
MQIRDFWLSEGGRQHLSRPKSISACHSQPSRSRSWPPLPVFVAWCCAICFSRAGLEQGAT